MSNGDNDWKAFRRDYLSRVRRVVVKVGSAVLTTSQGLNLRIISRLVDQLAGLHDRGLDVVLVSSGAVAAGRTRIKGELSGMSCKQAAAAVGQSRLMHEYDETFARYGKVTAQILLTRGDFSNRHRFLNARGTMSRLLDWRVIPIVNENDTVAVEELEFGDNDSMAGLVLGMVEGDLLINLTTAGGVFKENPANNPHARRYEVIEDIFDMDVETICEGKSAVGSGGMYSKLMSARRTAQLGVPTIIVSGDHPLTFERVFAGEDLGTWVMPGDKAISGRKFWLAYHQKPVGTLVVDAGAVKALRTGGRSLLPIGIRSVEGCFEAGSLVLITSPEGEAVGVGQCNYSSADIVRVLGKRTKEIEALLGPDYNTPEAVHTDNMLLDAAI